MVMRNAMMISACYYVNYTSTMRSTTHAGQSAQISQKQDEHNIHIIMKTKCFPGCHHNSMFSILHD